MFEKNMLKISTSREHEFTQKLHFNILMQLLNNAAFSELVIIDIGRKIFHRNYMYLRFIKH
ncbi:hypothetical protein BpHYR1_050563 [Brachionus plicatilis]|uniref:Uncharacterized protein n=1 Tax=Brachionus plicatilis TaxID=10195 RepID=A0A3M7PBS9_BRAPC|nr:hypothetical protein BpHYR1_050563 [Brachionus plicatilis]